MNKMIDFITDNSFKIIIKDKTLYINNFKKMNLLDEQNIELITTHKKIHIYGKNIKTKKLLENEILLTGIIEKIEVVHES